MHLPEELLGAIQVEAENVSGSELARASALLSRRYKEGEFSRQPVVAHDDRAAYLTARFPATYAATSRVFAELKRRAPKASITSLLDLAAGPGTASFAAAETFPELRQACLVEADASWMSVGQRLAATSRNPAVRHAEWVRHDLRKPFSFPTHDLVVISYALGELPPKSRTAVVEQAWRAAGQFLAIVEPGTMRGFGVIHEARSALIAYGAAIVAPCPHQHACPMAGTRDWCHFSQRLQRTAAHRRTKEAALSYEDEKFSYVIASRTPVLPAAARVVRHPRKHGGHVQLTLCAPDGITHQTVSRSDGPVYKEARHTEWGDLWTGTGLRKTEI